MFGTVRQDLASMLHAVSSLADAADDSERIERIRLLEELKSAVAAAQARETAAFAASRHAEHAGRATKAEHVDRDIAAQVALARRISPFQGRRYVGFASILTTELPATLDVLSRGGTSEWRAMLLAQHTIFLSREHRSAVDRIMAPQLGTLGDRRVEAETRRHAYRLDPQGYVDRMRAAEKDRRVGLRPAPDTMVRLSALLPVPQGVAAYAALSKTADTRRSSGDTRSRGQLMADTLVERILGHGADETPVELELVMTDRCLFSAADEPAWLVGYGPLPAGYARSEILDAPDPTPRWLRRLYTDPHSGRLAAMDSRRRLFTAAQRRFVRLRDEHCRTPYCGAPIRHIDHIQPYEHGGPTSITNAQGLCVTCNLAKQAPGWHSRTSGGHVEVLTPTGHRYRSSPPRPPGAPPKAHPPSRVELRLAALLHAERSVA